MIELKWFSVCLKNAHISSAIIEAVCVTFAYSPQVVMAFMHDRCAVNMASFRLTLAGVFPGADDNDCMPHTVMHVGEALAHPTLDELMGLYNTENSHSNYFKQMMKKITGQMPLKKSGTRWWGELDAVTKTVEPSLTDGKLLVVAEWLVANKHCEKSAGNMRDMLRDSRKLVFLKVEAAVQSTVGNCIKATGRVLEGDGYVQVSGYKELVKLKAQLHDPLTAPGLMDKLTAIAAAAPALPPPLPPTPFVAHAPVLALARGGPGRAAAAANVHAQPPAPLPAAAAAAAPTLGPIMGYGDILARGDLQDVEVLKELVRMAVVPAHNYCSTKIFGECLQQVRRMEAAVSFNPLSVKANGIGVSDVDRLAERYRFFDLVRFAGLAAKMKEELPSYLAAVAMIKPLNERLDEDDKDTFDIEAWWRSVHLGDLRAWADALCAVLCHVPNSCPPERAFSILNDSIGDDQTSALADYKKAMVMLQYNKRGR